MSRAGDVSLPFGGEERRFKLGIGQWRAVQEKCDAGPPELLRRYVEGTWRIDDLREVLFQGLVGGGLDQASATALIVGTFDPNPKLQFVPLAQAVVMASLIGDPEGEDLPGEFPARETVAASSRSRAARSASRTSTPKAPPSGGRPAN